MKMKKQAISRFTIMMIILIAGFAVVMLFYFFYPWKGQIDKDTCHQSIVTRSTFNYKAIEIGKKIIPLQCQTEEICATASGENCADYANVEDKITEEKIKNKQGALDVIARALYDCNSMLGRGNLNFMPHPTWQEKYCLICSRIAFDDKSKQILEKAGGISQRDVYTYLEKKADLQGKSYLSSIYKFKTLKELENYIETGNRELEKQGKPELRVSLDDKLDFNKGYGVVASLTEKGKFGAYVQSGIVVGVAVGAGVLAVVTVGVSIPATIVAFGAVGAVGGAHTFWVASPDASGEFVYEQPRLVVYDEASLKAQQCNSFKNAP